MYEIIDKILLFISSTAVYLLNMGSGYAIIPIILSISLSCLFQYFEDIRIRLAGNLLFVAICAFVPGYIVFAPLLLYDLFNTRHQYAAGFLFIFFLVYRSRFSLSVFLITTLFAAVSFLLKYKTSRINTLRSEYNELRDASSSFSRLMNKKNLTLLKNQDYEINLATLNERNRISREIHDSIGHMLSRALLQVGALLTMTKEDDTREGLLDLKASLSEGMDEIRNSIHKMYDDSIDLYVSAEKLIKSFDFCPVSFEYDISSSPPLMLRQSLLSIIREALTNIMRHSSATEAAVILREHPGLYQLIIQDNGMLDEFRKQKVSRLLSGYDGENGMGLQNITDRVMSFHGNINFNTDNGFKIFITIPKEGLNNSINNIAGGNQ
jgi:signal transduction histidine kinase